jgi:hypothetical protein
MAAVLAVALLLAPATGVYAAASPSEAGARLDTWLSGAWSSLGELGAEVWNGLWTDFETRFGATGGGGSTESEGSTDTEGDGGTDPGGGGGFVDPDGTFGG